MVDVKNEENEPALPSKRKPDLTSIDKDDDVKKQKLEATDIPEETIDEDEVEVEDDDDEDNEEEDDYEDDDDDEDGEHSNGKSGVDRKGKGIMKEDKGKGKFIEEDDSDDDESSDGEGELDGDSDLSDDPLAEVDLDNILPSRTRRRVVNPGVYLANDLRGNDDSDDSDA